MVVQPMKECATKVVMVVVLLLPLVLNADAAVYKVGDSAGWTTIGNIDYKTWAATKTFALSDLIVFQYNPQFHNVMQVSHAAYKACNTSSPIATHTTGNDTITITRHGHYFFLCGVPGHCQAGQKVDIHVPRVNTTTTPSMAPSPSVSGATSPANPVASALSPGPSSAAAASVAPLMALVSVTASVVLAFFLGSQFLI